MNGDKVHMCLASYFDFRESSGSACGGVVFWVGAVFYRPVPCNFKGIMIAVSGLIFAGMTLGNNSQVSPDVGAARLSATHIFRLLD